MSRGSRRTMATALCVLLTSCLAGRVGPVPWSTSLPPVADFGPGFVASEPTRPPEERGDGRPEGLAASGGYGYLGVGHRIWVVDLQQAQGPTLAGRTPPLAQRVGPMLWSNGSLYVTLRGLTRQPAPGAPTEVAPGLRQLAAERQREPDAVAVFDLGQPSVPRLRGRSAQAMHTVMDLVAIRDELFVFGAPQGAGDGAANTLSITPDGVDHPPTGPSLYDSLPFTDVTLVSDRLYTTYGRVLTLDLKADAIAQDALATAITSHLGREDWMTTSVTDATSSTLAIVVAVGGSYSPVQPQFEALLAINLATSTDPVILPGSLTNAQNTVASLEVDGQRLFTLQRDHGCALHAYDLANTLTHRGSVALPTDEMCGGGLHFLPDEGQRIAVTRDSILIGYDPKAAYVVDVASLDRPVVTGRIALDDW